MERPRSRRASIAFAVASLALVAALGVAPAGPAGAAGATAATPTGAAPSCPAAAGNARFVRFAYLELLGRCPDARGAAYWTAQLDRGTSRWRVADALDLSTENLGRNNVDQLYDEILGRAPTAAERTRWIDHIRAQREDAVPTATLIASDEAFARHTTGPTGADRERQWLDYAYGRVLDRAADPAGLVGYGDWLSDGGGTAAERYRVAMALERSPANAGSWVRATMAEALGRPGDPAGVAYWTRWLRGSGGWRTFELWTRQLSSDEAYRRAQTQPEAG